MPAGQQTSAATAFDRAQVSTTPLPYHQSPLRNHGSWGRYHRSAGRYHRCSGRNHRSLMTNHRSLRPARGGALSRQTPEQNWRRLPRRFAVVCRLICCETPLGHCVACSGRFLAPRMPAQLLKRDPDDLRRRSRSRMVQAGLLQPAYPTPRDPRQSRSQPKLLVMPHSNHYSACKNDCACRFIPADVVVQTRHGNPSGSSASTSESAASTFRAKPTIRGHASLFTAAASPCQCRT